MRSEVKVHEDKNLNNQSFVLDETVFIRCHLKNCDLFYSGGDFEWVETQMENCRFHWRGPAKNMLGMLLGMGLLKPPTAAQPAVPPTAGKPN
jgi:hypothetical protein